MHYSTASRALGRLTLTLALVACSTSAIAQYGRALEIEATAGAGVARSAILTVDSPSRTFRFLAETPGPIVVQAASLGAYRATLTGPGGLVLSTDTPLSTNELFVGTLAVPSPDGDVFAAALAVRNAPVGEWVCEVTRIAPLPDPITVEVLGLSQTGGVRVASFGGGEHLASESAAVRVGAVVFDGDEAWTGLSQFDAEVVTADGVAVGVITLADLGAEPDEAAGDGIFTGELGVALPPGEYLVRAELEGVARGGGAFLRPFGVSLTLREPRASFGEQVTDRSVDLQGDGLVDAVAVEGEIQTTEPLNLQIRALLTAPTGATIVASTDLITGVGATPLTLLFDAESLRDGLGVNGPWDIAELTAYEFDALGEPALVARRGYAGQSAPYDLATLQRDPISLVGDPDFMPVDIDFNGRFNRLDVVVPIEVNAPGVYSYSARLVDPVGNEVALTAGSTSLSAQNQSLLLVFPGNTIGESRWNGPYEVRNLLVFNASLSATLNEVGVSPLLFARQFEGYPTTVLADLNFDGAVTSLDVDVFFQAFGASLGQPAFNPDADLDGDGVVSLADFGILYREWSRAVSPPLRKPGLNGGLDGPGGAGRPGLETP